MGCLCLVLVLFCRTVCPFLFCNYPAAEDIELVAWFLLPWSSGCYVAVIVLCLFLAVPWVCLWCVIVVFPGQSLLRFHNIF